MTVLSLFDGISCGRLALERAGIAVKNYYASEIDKACISLAQKRFPDTVQLGDVKGIQAKSLPEIRLLMAGFPCQGMSSIGKGLNFDDPRSALFFEFERLLKEVKPKYFLLENVPMKKEYQNIISSRVGVAPISLNSNLVSAQNRERLYWTNIPAGSPPADKKITLKEIIEDPPAYRIPKNWQKYVPDSLPQYVDPYNKKALADKSTALRTNINNGNMWIKVPDGYRNLTRSEAEKLQTVPVGYTEGVSEAKAKKMLGNGWTIDVICHILSGMKKGGSK